MIAAELRQIQLFAMLVEKFAQQVSLLLEPLCSVVAREKRRDLVAERSHAGGLEVNDRHTAIGHWMTFQRMTC
jgi:hypothetical protein